MMNDNANDYANPAKRRRVGMRKGLFICLAMLFAALFLSCDELNGEVQVSRIVLDSASLEMNCGETAVAKVSISPSVAMNKKLEWTSRDDQIASVNKDTGEIFAKAVGDTMIDVKSVSNPDATAALRVICKARADFNSQTQSVYGFLTQRQTETLKDKVITWKDDEGILEFKDDGTMIPIGIGDTVVRAFDGGFDPQIADGQPLLASKDGESSDKPELLSFVVSVDKFVTGASFKKAEYSIGSSNTIRLSGELVISPDDATDKSVVWQSSNPRIANVDESGIVKGLKPGDAVITAVTADGGFKAECNVSVFVIAKVIPVDSISVDMAEMLLCVGESEVLNAVPAPIESNVGLIWSSTDEEVVSVDGKTGRVIAKKPGIADVVVSSSVDESVFCKCSVRVADIAGGYVQISGNRPFELFVADMSYGWQSSGKVEYAENPSLSLDSDKIVWREWDGCSVLGSRLLDDGTSAGDRSSDVAQAEFAKSIIVRSPSDEKDNVIWLRGSGLTYLTKKESKRWNIRPVESGDESVLRVSLDGDFRCLLEYDCPNRAVMANKCFAHMFSGCSYIESVPPLLFASLSESCFEGMFSGCGMLSRIPNGLLPSKTLAPSCYKDMFSGCSSLEFPCALPAEALSENCYEGMFSGCVSLEAFAYLPSGKLVKSCYDRMYYDCGLLRVLSGSEVESDQYEGGVLFQLMPVISSASAQNGFEPVADGFERQAIVYDKGDFKYYASDFLGSGVCPLAFDSLNLTPNPVVVPVPSFSSIEDDGTGSDVSDSGYLAFGQ